MRTHGKTWGWFLAGFAAVIVMGFLAGPRTSQAAAFPTKPIEMTVLFGAGSGADLLARKLAEAASKDLGQPILVVNRTRAGGAIGYNYLRGQAPDGYSIVLSGTNLAMGRAVNPEVGYEPVNDFAPIARLVTQGVILCVQAPASRSPGSAGRSG